MTSLLIAAAAALPTQGFRDEHAQVKQHLAHVAEWTGRLATQKGEARRATAQKIVAFFDQHIVPHAEWEEKNLYPVIDQIAGTTEANRYTATMRHEHRIVGRWIHLLQLHLEKGEYVELARRSDNLLGLITAHFEEEEEVLLPWADRSMTRAEFEEKVKLAAGH